MFISLPEFINCLLVGVCEVFQLRHYSEIVIIILVMFSLKPHKALSPEFCISEMKEEKQQ